MRAGEARGSLGQILSVPVASPSAEAERPSPPRIPSPPLCPFPRVNTGKTERGLRKGTELDLRKNFQVLIQSKRVQANVRTAMVELQRIV